MKTMYKVRGWEYLGAGQKEVGNEGHRTHTKKRRNEILFTSCEGPSLGRVWQCPTDSQQTIIISRKTDVSRGTGMCLNIINVF